MGVNVAVEGPALQRAAIRPVGFTVWLTGLPCSGKSTVAAGLAASLRQRLSNVEILDGDEVREILSKGLGFTRADRDINVRRIGFVAGLLSRNGVAVVVAAVSPYAAARDAVGNEIRRFLEVHVDCPLAECERRDVKGMYKRARAGAIHGFTGIDDPYEPPAAPAVTLKTQLEDVSACVERILEAIERRGYLRP